MTNSSALKENEGIPRNKINTEKVKAAIIISVVALCLILFFFCNLLTKSQMDIGVTFSYSFLTVLAVLFSGGNYSAYDEYGNLLDTSVPSAVTAVLIVLFVVMLLTLAFTVLRYTRLKKMKNVSAIAYGLYLGNAALIFAAYVWLMFYSGETSSLYGETVGYYRVFETTPVALVIVIFFLFAAAAERRVKRKTMGLIVRFLPVYGFMILPLAFIFVFNLYPIVIQTVLSFKDHTMQGSVWNGEWVGFKHFVEIFSDKTMLAVIGRTLYISLLRLIVGILPSLILSICLYDLKSKTLRSIFQNIVYIPHFFSWVVVYAITYALLSPKGLINGLFGTSTDFLVNEKWFMPIVIISAVWKELGWGTILYLAALSGVDTSLFEAAKIDGASPLQRIWHITIPCIKGTIIFLTVMSLGSILKGAGGEQLLLFYSATTKDQALVIDTWLVWYGKDGFQYSLGAAMSFFQSAIGMIMVLGCNKLSQKLCDVSMW